MPYIKPEHRTEIDAAIDQLRTAIVNTQLDDETATDEGMLNYAITSILMQVYGTKDNTRYASINNAIGVLECCKLELYRKVAAPYEDEKAEENGEVVVNVDIETEMPGVVVMHDMDREPDGILHFATYDTSPMTVDTAYPRDYRDLLDPVQLSEAPKDD